MICGECAKVAQENRKLFEMPDRLSNWLFAHPENCGCACQHRDPDQWEKMFSVKRPNGE